MSLLGWAKPEYLLQPRRLLRRLTAGSPNPHSVEIMLPWGLPILVQPGDFIGAALRRLGVYDLAVSETLWRLTDAGETVVDVGANVGYTTAVVAGRLGRSGRVVSFEPHPDVFRELEHNVICWQKLLPGIRFEYLQAGLSDANGKLMLAEEAGFRHNRGVAKVDTADAGGNRRRFEVPVMKLDDAMGGARVHLLKLDVEGYESVVLRGARQFVEGGRIREVIFEEH